MENLLETTESKRIVCFHAKRRMNGSSVCCPTLSFTGLENVSSLLMIKRCRTSNAELITLGQDVPKRPDSQSGKVKKLRNNEIL